MWSNHTCGGILIPPCISHMIRFGTYSIISFKAAESTKSYTLSLHDALPIYLLDRLPRNGLDSRVRPMLTGYFEDIAMVLASCREVIRPDRKSTRLNSSH